jgi:anaerobic selenocysteine-containing dehydrogenase
MGYDDAMFKDSEAEMIAQGLDCPENPYLSSICYEKLERDQFVKAAVSKDFIKNLPTPSGKIELYSAALEADGYPPLPTYVPLVHDGDYPYLFVPAPNHNFLNSTFSNNAKHVRMEKIPKLFMHAADAEASGIADGDRVRVWNDRGECELTVSVGETVLRGVVVSLGLWGDQPGSKHNVNALTPDRLADMGGGATFFSGRVNVARA